MEKIKLPTCWEEVYVDQFIQLKKLDETDNSFFFKQHERLAILSDLESSDSVWDDIDMEELDQMLVDIKFLNKEPNNQHKKVINDLHLIDLNKISLGEYIDLEVFSRKYYENFSKICSILYRKVNTTKWGNIEVEPYDEIDLEKRKFEFEELPITDVFGALKYFFDFKDNFITIFKNHFSNSKIEDDYDETVLSKEEIEEIEKENKMIEIWAWDKFIYDLAEGNLLNYDKILNLPLYLVFNYKSLVKDLNLSK